MVGLRKGSDGAAVGDRVRWFRLRAGVTQEELARSAKLTPKFVSQIENGHVNPSIGVLSRLVQDGLEMPLAAFFAGAPDGEVRDDLASLAELFGSQPAEMRKRALRVLRALCDEPADGHPRRKRT
jgi:transcriptional regulator with XRE-family HTH domain